METFALFTAAIIGAFLAGYVIASDCATRDKQRLHATINELRKLTACACGLPHAHTGKHAPMFAYTIEEGSGLISDPPKITRSRIPVQPKKGSTQPSTIHRTMSPKKKA